MMRNVLKLSMALAAALYCLCTAPAAAQEKKPAADQLAEEQPAAKPAPAVKSGDDKSPAAKEPTITEMTPAEAERQRKAVKAVTDPMLADARKFMTQRDYDHCIDRCEQILKLDGSNLDAQKLKYQAEKAKIDHRLKMLEHESTTKDKQAVADLDEASNFPDKKGALPRPVNAPKLAPLPLRTTGAPAKSDKLLAMEQKLNQRVDINFVDADLDFVMSTLFRITGVNIIADQKALKDKRLTLHVEAMPLKEILRFIVRNNSDVSYTVTEDAVWISAGGTNPGLEPRIHALNAGLVNSNPLQALQAVQVQGGGNNALPIPQPQNNNNNNNNNQQQTKTYLEETMAWIEGWKEWPSGSKWSIDKFGSALLVYTTPEMHDKIDEMLELADRPPIQILISTRFITVSVDDLRDIGLDFAMSNKYPDKVGLATGSGSDTGAASIAGGLSAIVKGAETDPLFTATLKALEKTGRGKLLSAPQIITLNNQKGQIDITTGFNYITGWTNMSTSETTVNNGTVVTNPTVTWLIPTTTQQRVGFKLDVTPSVGRDLRHIVLELIPDISDVEGGTKQFGSVSPIKGDTAPPPVLSPIINTKRLNTRLVTKDGDLVIIGGLMGQDTTRQVKKVPILGDIPLLGWLFRHETDTVTKSHMIIVVKAQIIDPSGRIYEDGAANGNGQNKKEPAKGPWFVAEPAPAAPTIAK